MENFRNVDPPNIQWIVAVKRAAVMIYHVNTNTCLGKYDGWVKTTAKSQTCWKLHPRHVQFMDVVEEVGVGAKKLITWNQNV